jgi:hypothetical protein
MNKQASHGIREWENKQMKRWHRHLSAELVTAKRGNGERKGEMEKMFGL